LVDTPGVGSRDRKRAESLLALRDAVPDAEAAVLVPAGLHRHQASEVLGRFEPLAPVCAALTRIDDGLRHGEVVSALADAGMPLAFFTSGHVVPDDLEPATPYNLASLLLREGQDSPTFQESSV
jgi:flagellar biosynthesis GTPase FlhF